MSSMTSVVACPDCGEDAENYIDIGTLEEQTTCGSCGMHERYELRNGDTLNYTVDGGKTFRHVIVRKRRP